MSEGVGSRIPWVRVLAEGTAILVSILLAFGIEAWSDERGRAADEELFLNGLLQEIDEAIRDLEGTAEFQLRVVEAASRWREVTVATPPDTIANLVHRLGAYTTPTVGLSSADALLSAGLISSVADPEVRRWISSWPGKFTVFDRQAVAVADFARHGVLDYFAAQGKSFESIPRQLLPGDLGARPPRDIALLRSLVSDAGLRTVFVQGARVSALYIVNANTLREFLEVGRSLISESLRN